MRSTKILNPNQLEAWKQQGFLKIKQFYCPDEMQAIQNWVTAIAAWKSNSGNWMHHYELIASEKKLSRTENFIPYHEGMQLLLKEGKAIQVVSELFTEPAVLYKEKINYKYPNGGGGYAPHQDAMAYDGIKEHISCLIPVDKATIENGCLEMVAGKHRDGFLPTSKNGVIKPEVAKTLKWEPLELAIGDVLLFHSYTPHRSAMNKSDHPRRAIYATYNARSEGDLRDQYYRNKLEKLKSFEKAGGEKAERISLIGHFQGKSVKS